MKSAQGWNACIAKLLVVALLSCWGAEFALGQLTAAISGRVEDPSGAAVAGATLTVTSEETAATRTMTTDDAGKTASWPCPWDVTTSTRKKRDSRAKSKRA